MTSPEEQRRKDPPKIPLDRILVTGGAGFIGSHTVDLLLEKDKQVVVLDNLSSGKLENLNLKHPNLEFIEGDVLEYPFVAELVAGCDAIMHLAAIASVPQTMENPVYSFQVNVQGFLHVLEAIRTAHRPIRLVYASSAAIYGEVKDLPCRDDLPLTGLPLSPYAQHKLDNEQYAELYARVYGVPSLGLRYFNVYGPRQDPNSPYSGVISRFIDTYKKDEHFVIFGDGKQCRDFIHISDIARANWFALRSNYNGILNVATGQQESLLHMIQYIEEAGKKPAKFNFAPARSGDIKSSYASTQLAEDSLRFKYGISLKDGIKSLM